MLSSDIKYMMFFGVTVHEIDLLKGNNKFCKINSTVCMYVMYDMKLNYYTLVCFVTGKLVLSQMV